MFKNLSNPNPMITAAKVPPKTITIGGIRNNAFIEPPSKKKAPKIDTNPNIKPFTDPNFRITCNPILILEVSLKQLYLQIEEHNLAAVIPLWL